jgi:membrane-associated protein
MHRLFLKDMINLINLFLHLDKYIGLMIQNYGTLTYLIMFFVIFSETGFVLFTFFPGDTLLFVAGTFASTGAIKMYWLFIILSLAAILGDNLNYSIGKYFGEAILTRKRWVKEKNLEKTRKFFEKNGAKTIILARFIPIIRSLAPFVAGISEMKYKKFFSYNIIGGVLWVILMLTLGYFFGSIPFVKNNLSMIIIGIVILSWVPAIVAWAKREK